MKKFKIIFFIIFVTYFFYGCATMKKGFESQRKNSTDEFLVEKKQPLVMPPDFEKLPIPSQNQKISQQENINQIEELIVTDNSEDTNAQNSVNSNQKTENFILDKIKK
jgi:PBP1b-binding outer membrane lipoprotein LpoB|tara:strand:- start:119 stop:442 length:324 start_codon:yes stop_codon:yes gene_type:complete